VKAISGENGSTLWIRRSNAGITAAYERYGISVARAGDLDGDDIPDAIVGASQPPMYGGGGPPITVEIGPGYLQLLSGRTGEPLSVLVGSTLDGSFGAAVASLGDIDRDGLPDLLVAEPVPTYSNGGTARVRLYSGDRRNSSPQTYCVSAPNSSGPGARIGWDGTSSLSANDLALTVTGAVPGQLGMFLLSAEATAFPLGNFPYFGNGWQCLGGTQFRLGPASMTDSAGGARREFDSRYPPSGPGSVLPGSTWNFQFWYRDPTAPGLHSKRSDALAVTFSR
jgi:hypothetical protein